MFLTAFLLAAHAEDGCGLLPCYVRKTIEVLVKAETAFQIGEPALHRDARPLKQGAPLNRSGSTQNGRFRWKDQWRF